MRFPSVCKIGSTFGFSEDGAPDTIIFVRMELQTRPIKRTG